MNTFLMPRPKVAILFLLAYLSVSTPISAQSIRFDLGQRLRRLEAQFEKDLSESARQRVLRPMNQAVRNFFAGRLTDAARGLDQAWVELLPENQQEAAGWISALQVIPEGSLLVAGNTFQFRLENRYENSIEQPDDYEVVCELKRIGGERDPMITQVVLPRSDSYAVEIQANSDYLIRVSVQIENQQFPVGELAVARISDFTERVNALKAQVKSGKQAVPPWQRSAMATIKQQVRMLEQWAGPNTLETLLLPQQELLRLERIAAVADRSDWLPSSLSDLDLQQGSRRLWVKIVGEGRKSANLRLALPPQLNPQQQKVPCVIALHGAGGSENMFLDTYGDGKIAELCQQRGWILVAPRIGLGGVGLPMYQVMEELSKFLPIDPEAIVVVGHSMGAQYSLQLIKELQADDVTMEYPAVAAIGGGRPTRFQNSESRSLGTKFYVAAGSDDFGRGGAYGLHQSLTNQSLNSTWKEFSETEHLGIVQVCLEDVFGFFDAVLATQDP